MNGLRAWVGCVATGFFLSSCTTTGDPRQGGLFGWSEAKARQRQEERQERVTEEQGALAREDARTRNMEGRNARTDSGIAAANLEHQRAESKLRAQQAAVLAKVDKLETESPTPASSSRARSFRRGVNTTAARTDWTIAQRSMHLREIETQIDAALERLGR